MDVPQWVIDVVDSVESKYGFKLDNVFFKAAKNEDYRSGCYWHNCRSIELFFGEEKTDIRLWVVLHELAHAIQHIVVPETLTPNVKGKRRVVHNRAFFDMAKELYIRYGVLDTAAKHEYKTARPLMVA
jgi:hypothetical protein